MTRSQRSSRVESAPAFGGDEAVFVLAPTLVDCSERFCRLLGRSREQLMARSLAQLCAESRDEHATAELAQREEAARAGLSQSFTCALIGADDAPVEVLVTLEAQGEEELVGRVQDLGGLVRAENALRESEARLQQILNNATAVVYVKHRDGRYLHVNRQYLRVFGLGEADVVGRRDDEVFPRAVDQAFRSNDRQVLEQQRPLEFEETAHIAGTERAYISIKFPLYDTAGEAYAVCGISTDITERKRTERALRGVAFGVSAARGPDVFAQIARHLAETLQVEFAFVGQLIDATRAKTLAMYHDGVIGDNLEYDLSGTPCEKVIGREFQFVPAGVTERYPGDNLFKVHDLESYAGYPLFDSRGQPLGLVAVIGRRPLVDREVTESILKIFSVRAAAEIERLQADEAARISEQSYRAIFEASEDAVFVHDFDTGAIVDVNPKACTAYGYSREELTRLDLGDLSSGVAPYTLEGGLAHIERAKAGEPQCFEWHRRNKDGTLHWDEVFLKRATIAGKDRILAFTREITERRAREEALRESEDRLRATVEAALDCIIGMDVRGDIVEFNPAAEGCFGYRRDEIIGRPLGETLIPERYREAHRRGLEHYRQTGSGPYVGRRVEVTAMRADGTEFPAELAIAPAQGPEGDIFIGYLRDITERKQAEEERLRLEAQLRQAQKMEAIGHLTGGVAHDFNNILTGIMGYIVLAQEWAQSSGDAKLTKYLDNAQRSGHRARDLIQQMLTFSRGQRGERRALVLGPLVKEAVRLLRSTLPSTIELVTDLGQALPPALLDPVQVEQVLMNLCINARDAMGGTGRIHVTTDRVSVHRGVCASCRQAVDGDYVALGVADAGAGIGPEVLDRMFEPFFSTKGVGRGSGMGLAVVHGIVHECDGHVLVETVPGHGARFHVLFPPIEAAAQAPVCDGGTVQGASGRRLQGRVLVVDDDELVGELMGDLLGGWGLEVTVEGNAQTADRRLAADPDMFDLVIFDQTMPKLTGLTLARHVQAVRPDLPVVLYTGYRECIDDQAVAAAGVRAVLDKPLDPEVLFEQLQALLADPQ